MSLVSWFLNLDSTRSRRAHAARSLIPAAVATVEPRQMLSGTAADPRTVTVAQQTDPATGSPIAHFSHFAGGVHGAARSFASSAAAAGYTPAQLLTAYGITGDGTGQTIAIIDAYDDPNIKSDLATFDSQLGIAAPPSFQVVNQNGGSTLPGADPSRGWETETALDVEWAHAAAPKANIILVEANSASDNDLFTAVNWARNNPNVTVISMSWGSDDNAANAAWDQSLSNTYLVTPAGHQGVTFIASAGDTGVASFPATSPNVLAVGGTNVYLTSSNQISSETAWTPQTFGGVTYSGGGGTSVEFTGRNTPDVSANAGISMAVYDTYGSTGWVGVGGTSASAPFWAGIIATADGQRVGNGLKTFDNATLRTALYSAPSNVFHDIVTGSTQYQQAKVGYDLATGLGTPNGALLQPYLANYGSSTTTGVAAPTNVQAKAASTTSATVSWTAVTGATGYTVYQVTNTGNTAVATFNGAGSGTVSVTVNGLTAGSTVTFFVQSTDGKTTANSGNVNLTLPSNVATPTNVKVTAASSTSATVSWSAVSGATGYTVFQVLNGKNTAVATYNGAGSGTVSVTVGNLVAGSTVTFFVQSTNGASTASSGNVSVTLPTSTSVTAPTNVTLVQASTTSATLSWSAVANATGYNVYQVVSGVNKLVRTINGAGSGTVSTTFTGLATGSTVTYFVSAFNNTSTANSSPVSLTLSTSTKVTAPTNVTATATSTTTGTLSWSPATNQTGYRIYYWTGAFWMQIGQVGASTTSVSISGMQAGSTYYFQVVAFNSTSSAAAPYVALTTPVSNAKAAATGFYSRQLFG